jgi:beta-lactamase regulating signal transducer with metallopeptidase domain
MITPFIDQTSIQALAWALVHFLWQGAVLGLIAFVLLRLSRLRATTKYLIGVGTLGLMLAAPVGTFLYLNRTPSRTIETATVVPSTFRPTAAAQAKARPNVYATASEFQIPVAPPTPARPLGPYLILTVWLSGVVLLSLRLFGGWVVARRLVTRAIRPVSPEVLSLVRRVAGRLALDRVVRVFESSAVSVPVMVGWIKPVVLLPAAALSGLTPTQVEALIAHELAHVRRHDYLVNLLQSAVETLLFYHPAVWWVSARVRAEREHCCDDLAVGVCDRLVYVTALADLAAMTTPRVALAATDGSLVNRVRRLLGRTRATADSATSWSSALTLAVVLGALLPAGLVLARGTEARPYASAAQEARAGVASGVRGGVAGGVTGGVATAVAKAPAEGVAGAVAEGVEGGVYGGIAGGVTGGVAGGLRGGIEKERVREAVEGLVGDAAIKAAFAEPGQWRIERDEKGRWRLMLRQSRAQGVRWRFEPAPDGRLRIVREGLLRGTGDQDLQQAEAALRERIKQLEQELAELRRHYAEMQQEQAKQFYTLTLNDQLMSAKAYEQLLGAQQKMGEKMRLDQEKLGEQLRLAQEKLGRDYTLLLQQDNLRNLLATTEAQRLTNLDADRLKLLENATKASTLAGKVEGKLEGKPLNFQSTSQKGSGNFTWSNDGDKVAIKWTGAFRISDDDKDIVWVEAGKSVQVSDGGWVFSTGVEVKGLADGKVERSYYRNSIARPYEPEGREFLATMLQKVVRVSGFGAESRVERFLKQGGVNAVLAEIELLQGDYARRVYYTELLKQAKVPPAELARIMGRASATIQSDYELASLVVTALGASQGDEAARIAAIDATKTIGSDYEMRRALTAALTEPVSAKVSASVLAAAANIQQDYERATLLIDVAKKGGLVTSTKTAYFDLVKGIRSPYEQGRVLRSATGTTTLPEDVMSDAVKASQTMSGDYERRQFLSASMARQPVTPKNAGDVLQSAAGIKSDNERATLLVDLAKKGGVTNETAAAFFPLVSSMPSSYEQRRVLQAVLASAPLSDPVLTGLLKAAATISSDYECAETLLAVARKHTLAGTSRSLYLAAADTIASEHDQTRVLAELVRSERAKR